MNQLYSYRLTESSTKSLRKLPKDIQSRIITKLDFFISSDNPLVFAHTLKNAELGSYRFRVGNYRIIFDVEETILVILKIKHRREVYK